MCLSAVVSVPGTIAFEISKSKPYFDPTLPRTPSELSMKEAVVKEATLKEAALNAYGRNIAVTIAYSSGTMPMAIKAVRVMMGWLRCRVFRGRREACLRVMSLSICSCWDCFIGLLGALSHRVIELLGVLGHRQVALTLKEMRFKSQLRLES